MEVKLDKKTKLSHLNVHSSDFTQHFSLLSPGDTPLSLACANGRCDVAAGLLSEKADLNTTNDRGNGDNDRTMEI